MHHGISHSIHVIRLVLNCCIFECLSQTLIGKNQDFNAQCKPWPQMYIQSNLHIVT